MTEERFSLKDHLFNKEKIERLAAEIKAAHPAFDDKGFVRDVVQEFPKLELLQRIDHIVVMFESYLPRDFREATNILLRSLPPVLDTDKGDDDFGDFIYAPHGAFVAKHGCTKKELSFSLKALHECTMRFSVEGPIRVFINTFPKETFTAFEKWASDTHYHVRRAASECTRPLLPWAKKITTDYHDAMPLLDRLYADRTRFVTRSVANHLNDISKLDPQLVVETLQRWQQEGKQTKKELQWITSHALRTLVKQGHPEALRLLGYGKPKILIKDFQIETPTVKVGESLQFSFTIVSQSTQSQSLLIDYVLYFQKANGSLSPKTHKITKKNLMAGETLHIDKKHPLRLMTTRRLHPGQHEVELQINGHSFDKCSFLLVL